MRGTRYEHRNILYPTSRTGGGSLGLQRSQNYGDGLGGYRESIFRHRRSGGNSCRLHPG